MAFTVEEFRDIVRIIEQHPEWRAELRRLVLTEELLSLPELVRELGEAQKRTEERLGVLEEHMATLAAEQERASRHLGELAAAMLSAEKQLHDMGKDVGDLKGMGLELRYQNRAASYFFRLIRGTHVVSSEELQRMLATAVEKGQLSDEEVEDLLWADVVVRGRSREEGVEIYLVVEVSWGIGSYDVERAARRAGLLAKTGVKAVPVVAGKSIDADTLERARSMQVRWVLNGQTSN